ncbi:MAG: hypothetical protein AABZ34_16325 [Nitrospirota bacterium]
MAAGVHGVILGPNGAGKSTLLGRYVSKPSPAWCAVAGLQFRRRIEWRM